MLSIIFTIILLFFSPLSYRATINMIDRISSSSEVFCDPPTPFIEKTYPIIVRVSSTLSIILFIFGLLLISWFCYFNLEEVIYVWR